MADRKAIVTLTVGKRIADVFRRSFRPSWEAYCCRHGLDLVQIERPLDESARAAGRSLAWQKLLVHRAEEVLGCERIAWVDADVMIQPDAPDVFGQVPRDKVGAVDDFATPSREDHDLVMDRLYSAWDAAGICYVSNRTATEYYRNYGIECGLDSVVQTGVLVFSPDVHGELFDLHFSGGSRDFRFLNAV